MPTRRELFLQNRLAMAASLLYRVAKALARVSPNNPLVIECETFFSETRSSLAAELAAPEPAAMPTSVKSAVKSGAGSDWVHPNGWPSPGLAKTTEVIPDKPLEASSNPLSGGTTSTEIPSNPNSETPVPNSFAMRLKFALATGLKRTNEVR